MVCRFLSPFTVLWLCSIASALKEHRVLHLLNENYDVNAWPDMESGKPTEVEVEMDFNSFGSLDAAHMDFKIDMFLRQRWTDKRLQHSEGTDHFTIMNPELHKRIWKPDTYFENVKESHIHDVTMPNMLMRVYKSGEILYSIRVTLKLSCHLELELYPFDAQKCFVLLSSFANTDDVIKYKWSTKQPLNLSPKIEIAQFDLLSKDISNHTTVFNTGLMSGNFSGLTASFSLRRQNGYHLLQTYIPTIIIVAISWVNFWLDPNAVPGRVTLGVTTLLTLTTLSAGIRQTLPPVSYVKVGKVMEEMHDCAAIDLSVIEEAIDVWVGMCMIMVFGALLEFTLVNYLANKKMLNSRLPDLITIPGWLAGPKEPEKEEASPKTTEPNNIELVGVQSLENENSNLEDIPRREFRPRKPAEKPKKKQGEGPTYMFYALVIDRFCRLFFPFTFLLFNLGYWPFYVYMQRTMEHLKTLQPS